LGLGALDGSRVVTQRRPLEAALAEAGLGLTAGYLAAATRSAAAAEISLRKAY